MHVPDHFLDPATSVATAVAAGAVLTVAGARLRKANLPAQPSLFAATTAAVFGLQMLNYPIAGGTSGHLIGAALAAAVLGPLWGMFSITLVLVVQCLVFADGGLTALGTNVLLMAVIGTLVGSAVTRGLLALTKRRSALALGVAAGLGGLVSVVAAAAVFTGLFAIGGTVEVGLGELARQMIGVHLLVGVGEAVITGTLVAGLAAFAPGIVSDPGSPLPKIAVRKAGLGLGVLGLLAAALLSGFASAYPDGLESTAATVGFAGAARDHLFATLPLADYGAAGGLAVGLAGAIGFVVCVLAALAASRVLRPRRFVAA